MKPELCYNASHMSTLKQHFRFRF